MTLEQLKELWPFILFVSGCIVWIIRLESKLIQTNEKIVALEKDQTKLETDIWKKLNEMNSEISQLGKTLSRIEGKLEITFDKH